MMMLRKKDLIFTILATFCLTSLLFLVIPIRSPTTAGEYDPWIDTNDDGIIDYQDLYNLASIYRTSGTPINKTDLLLELQNSLDSLDAKVTTLEGDVDELETTTDTLNTMVLNLLSRVEVLEGQTGLHPPDYDSGWVSTDIGTTMFTHNLGTTDVLVYVVGYKPITPETGGVHQTYYGGIDDGGYYYGCYWHRLTDTTIDIVRRSDDPYWTQVRVMMWKIPSP